MARVIRIVVIWLVVLALAAAAFLAAREYVRRHPQDVPWTPLRLDDPVGIFTLRKLASLSESTGRCRGLLADAGSADVPVPPRQAGPSCGYSDGMRLAPGTGEATLSPAGVVTSCPVAAALYVFERQVVQAAAFKHFGSRVTRIHHAGSYSCRRLYGREDGRYSEHATANAIDIFGFDLADGTSVNVLRDWHSVGPKADFLRDVRDGSCRLFSTALSPDYNEAHADHLHLDQARRGRMGWSLCR